MNADSITIEADEDGFRLRIHGERLYVFPITDPEQLYDQVKARIGPWLRERDEAREVTAGEMHEAGMFFHQKAMEAAYDVRDPKHPDHHSIHADIWDMRDGK